MSRRNDRRDALAEFYHAEVDLARVDAEAAAAGIRGEHPAFLAANRRVWEAEQQLPWWWRAWLSNAWRMPLWCLRHPVLNWRSER
jgi:hypothetical protein